MSDRCSGKSIYQALLSEETLSVTQAFDCLHLKIFPNILKEVKEKEIADDLFQNMIIDLWSMGKKQSLYFKSEGGFFALCNLIWKRKWWAQKKKELPETTIIPEDLPFDEDKAEPEKEIAFNQCWLLLTPMCRRIIYLRMHEYSYEEILEILKEDEPDLKIGTVRMRYHRCMEKLSECGRGKYFALVG